MSISGDVSVKISVTKPDGSRELVANISFKGLLGEFKAVITDGKQISFALKKLTATEMSATQGFECKEAATPVPAPLAKDKATGAAASPPTAKVEV